ncbi:hypothetical protein QQ73_10620, partial [Candidatus Endoriftia persephone str. Guaymas]|nr:hypothetical protein [Candidatus Endoriftia persephone str. Guaymas]
DHQLYRKGLAGRDVQHIVRAVGRAAADLYNGQFRHLGANTQVSLQRELYLYKQWLSYDGKSWQPTHEQVDFTLSAGLNGEGGKVVVKANDR